MHDLTDRSVLSRERTGRGRHVREELTVMRKPHHRPCLTWEATSKGHGRKVVIASDRRSSAVRDACRVHAAAVYAGTPTGVSVTSNAALIVITLKASLTWSHLPRDEDERALDGREYVFRTHAGHEDADRLITAQRWSMVGKTSVTLDGELDWSAGTLHARKQHTHSGLANKSIFVEGHCRWIALLLRWSRLL